MSPSDAAAGDGAALEGFCVVDKPSGLTSHKLLATIKRSLGSKAKLGHAGTLDSFASGVLITLFGRYTRLSDYFMAAGKGYEAVVRFGVETDTLDPDGTVVAQGPLPAREALERALPAFRGAIMQAPPAYSAVHVDGERAYERAMRGEDLAMKARPVTISSLELLSFDGAEASLRIACSKGTYRRSLARDLALACASRGHLAALRRTFSGPFRVEDAVAPEAVGASTMRRLDESLARGLGLASVRLGAEAARNFACGMPLYKIEEFKAAAKAATRPPAEAAVDAAPLAVFGPDGALLGIVRRDGVRRDGVRRDGARRDGGAWRYAFVLEGSA